MPKGRTKGALRDKPFTKPQFLIVLNRLCVEAGIMNKGDLRPKDLTQLSKETGIKFSSLSAYFGDNFSSTPDTMPDVYNLHRLAKYFKGKKVTEPICDQLLMIGNTPLSISKEQMIEFLERSAQAVVSEVERMKTGIRNMEYMSCITKFNDTTISFNNFDNGVKRLFGHFPVIYIEILRYKLADNPNLSDNDLVSIYNETKNIFRKILSNSKLEMSNKEIEQGIIESLGLVDCYDNSYIELMQDLREVISAPREQDNVLTINSDVCFDRVTDTVNTVFGTNAERYGKGFFIPTTFKGTKYENHHVWFPLAERVRDDEWVNVLLDNGQTIYERNKNYPLDVPKNEVARIVFWGDIDYKIGKLQYKFIGIFKFDRIENGGRYYTRIDDKVYYLR